jgi:hypothetical protein
MGYGARLLNPLRSPSPIEMSLFSATGLPRSYAHDHKMRVPWHTVRTIGKDREKRLSQLTEKMTICDTFDETCSETQRNSTVRSGLVLAPPPSTTARGKPRESVGRKVTGLHPVRALDMVAGLPVKRSPSALQRNAGDTTRSPGMSSRYSRLFFATLLNPSAPDTTVVVTENPLTSLVH